MNVYQVIAIIVAYRLIEQVVAAAWTAIAKRVAEHRRKPAIKINVAHDKPVEPWVEEWIERTAPGRRPL